MKNLLLFTSLLFFIASCKSHKLNLTKKTTSLSQKKLLKRIKKNEFSARSFESRFNIKYKDASQSFNGNGKVRILKDSIIWGSINFMGIPVVKFYLTPSQIQYYNKIEKKYYSGDYQKINEILGADLNFYHIQNILLGNSLLPATEFSKYELNILPKIYRLKENHSLITEMDVNPSYKVVSEKIVPNNSTQLLIRYTDFKEYSKHLLPLKIRIITHGDSANLSMDIQYKNISLNKDLHFPFSIPSNYSKIDF